MQVERVNWNVTRWQLLLSASLVLLSSASKSNCHLTAQAVCRHRTAPPPPFNHVSGVVRETKARFFQKLAAEFNPVMYKYSTHLALFYPANNSHHDIQVLVQPLTAMLLSAVNWGHGCRSQFVHIALAHDWPDKWHVAAKCICWLVPIQVNQCTWEWVLINRLKCLLKELFTQNWKFSLLTSRPMRCDAEVSSAKQCILLGNCISWGTCVEVEKNNQKIIGSLQLVQYNSRAVKLSRKVWSGPDIALILPWFLCSWPSEVWASAEESHRALSWFGNARYFSHAVTYWLHVSITRDFVLVPLSASLIWWWLEFVWRGRQLTVRFLSVFSTTSLP